MNVNTTYPGINRSVNKKYLSDEEMKIITNISKKYWYVTRIERVDFANCSYNVAFLKPVDYITQNFNLNREVVLILSNYNQFQARALDAYDYLCAQALRMEEVCCLLASKDENIENQITSLLKSNNEARIIVPFSYNELIDLHDDEVVVNKMRRHFFSRDLFGIQNALKKEIYFFGRRELIQELVNKHENNENAGIFGLRKTGKTSILYGVIRTLTKKKSLPVFIDCQTLHNQPWNLALYTLALYTIVNKIVEEGHLKHAIAKKNADRYKDESQAHLAFETDIKDMLQNHLKKNILLIFDEIENVTFDTSISESWKSGVSFVKFWQVIRSVYQSLNTRYHYTFLIAGTNPRCVEKPSINKTDNPIFSQFTPHYIEPFSCEQTKEMINRLGGYMGMSFPEEVITHIQEDFGGHPLLMRQMCSYIHQHLPSDRPRTICKQDYEAYKQDFYKNQTGFSQYAEMILQVLEEWYPDEYQMLIWLAVGDYVSFQECAQETEYVKHLKCYGIVGEDRTPTKYHFNIEALQQHLANRNKYQRPLITDEERETEIQHRRSEIEKKLRSLVRRQLKSSLGEAGAKEQMIREIYSPREVGHKSNVAYADFFDPYKHKVYLKTLLNVIHRNYALFAKLFNVDVETFDSKAVLLNQYRRADAHSIPISESDFTIFRGIAQWFEDVLSEE